LSVYYYYYDDDDDDDDKFNICLSYLCKNLSTHTEIKKNKSENKGRFNDDGK